MIARARRSASAAVIVVALVLGSGAVASATESDATTESERIAKRFLAAYGAYDAKRALNYLAEEGVATGSGHTTSTWATREGFRREVAMVQAEAIEQRITGCEEVGRSVDGVAVQCAFDVHAFRSDEVGLGPYTDNTWDLVVRNGKITSAVSTWAYITNGFSAERWEPFQRWVTSTHPEDVPVMYPVGEFEITKRSIKLWKQRLREWVAAVKAGTA
jgi:ketosteroid isomerase-like protein